MELIGGNTPKSQVTSWNDQSAAASPFRALCSVAMPPYTVVSLWPVGQTFNQYMRTVPYHIKIAGKDW